jgi:hypothetical protein
MYQSKKILAFTMLLTVAAPIFFFIGFLVKQKAIQHEMKEKLESSLLQTISVNKTGFKWVKKNKEIIVDGRLFDVKNYSFKNNYVTFTGLYDEAEQQLKKDFAGLLQHNKNESGPLEQLMLKFIFTSVINKNTLPVILSAAKTTQAVYFAFNESVIDQPLPVPIPPPDF